MIEVNLLPTLTLYSTGNTGNEEAYIVGNGHKYRVRARVTLSPGANFDPDDTGVIVVYIDPQSGKEKSGAPTLESNSTTDYFFDLPGSDGLELCQPMFYRWTAVYDLIEGERGVYFGEEQYVQPSKYHPTPNSVAQAMCQAPSTTP